MEQDYTREITNERVRMLYERVFAGNGAVIAGALIFSYIFRDKISLPLLLGWLGFMFACTLIRYWLLFDYKKYKEKTTVHAKFENRYLSVSGLLGVGWAFFVVLGLSLPDFEYRIYSLLLLISVIALSVPSFSPSIKTLYVYITPSLIIVIPLLFFRGGNDIALGIGLVIFAFLVVRSNKDIYRTLIDTLTLQFKTQTLADDLKQLRHAKSESEERMQGIMDYAPTAIYVKDLDGRFTFLNQKVADLFHAQREDLIGKTLHDILPEDIADEIHQNDIDIIKSGKPRKYKERSPQDDGLHYYMSIKFPLFDKTGKLHAVGGVSTDVTESFRAEESLRISQQRLLLHREQSPVGVIEWNTDFEFLDWNPAAQKIFGFTKDEVIGKHITKRILPESARPAVDKVWADLLANKGGAYSLNENTTKDGRTILCEWHNTPLIDHDGNVIGVTSLVEDVTNREHDEEKLRHAQKMDAIGKLTGGIAHDFNNALASILGYSELLLGIVDPDSKQHKFADQIYQSGERAKKLTSKLLAFSRKEAATSEVTNINQLLQGEKHMLEKTLTPRIRLELELAQDLWPVWLDKSSLEDAILNMAINAMHAMPNGGAFKLSTSNVNLSSTDVTSMHIEAGNYVKLSLTDTGIGMNSDTRQKIFDPFFSTKGSGGTGLGMSQVYGFVQQSNGSIHVNSEPEQGTQINLYFPHYIEDVDIPQDETNHQQLKNLDGDETILVVDDEPALRELVKEILHTHGYEVLLADGGKQALKTLETENVDLLLTDILMPEMDGHQLAHKVQQQYPQLKIQLASGYNDNFHSDLIDDELDQQQLQKPYSAKSLLIRVRKLLDE